MTASKGLDAPRVLGEFTAFVELRNETLQFQKDVDSPNWAFYDSFRSVSKAQGIDLEEAKAQRIESIWAVNKHEALKKRWEKEFRTDSAEMLNRARLSYFAAFADLRGKYALDDPIVQKELAELLIMNRFQWDRPKSLIRYYADNKSYQRPHEKFKDFILDPDDDEVRMQCIALSLMGLLHKEEAYGIMIEEAKKAGFRPERIGKGCLSVLVVAVFAPLFFLLI